MKTQDAITYVGKCFDIIVITDLVKHFVTYYVFVILENLFWILCYPKLMFISPISSKRTASMLGRINFFTIRNNLEKTIANGILSVI